MRKSVQRGASNFNNSFGNDSDDKCSNKGGGVSKKRASKLMQDPNYAHFPGDSWLQVVCKGQLPPSRCNMGYAIAAQYLYILGGQDLNKGLYNSCWRINM